ncbi:hypothetical protein KI387_043009 [Taxus chinensis]|uniref:Uncharacterized protein n=1 Tax=Taxus chinensis TaxID=29808 RepID=A0AA38F6U1_TAXCH|nr:hypothetical protein KI387_043009 [Taxus chinensis]
MPGQKYARVTGRFGRNENFQQQQGQKHALGHREKSVPNGEKSRQGREPFRSRHFVSIFSGNQRVKGQRARVGREKPKAERMK